MSQAFRWICVIVFSCLLLACTDYRIVRPTTEAGKLCAAECDKTKATCDFHADADAGAAGSCESGNERAEEICSRHEGEFHDRCMAAESTPVCVDPAPEYGPCKSKWELCVLSCGGRMVEK